MKAEYKEGQDARENFERAMKTLFKAKATEIEEAAKSSYALAPRIMSGYLTNSDSCSSVVLRGYDLPHCTRG